MSDCVEGGRGGCSRGVDAIKAQSMVGGTRGGISAHSLSCGANSSQGASVDCVVGVGVGNIRC